MSAEIKLTCVAGRKRDMDLGEGIRALELVLQDGRSDPDGPLEAASLVRVRIEDPAGDGFYRRSFLLAPGQRVVLDVATIVSAKVSILAAENIDGHELWISQLDRRPPDLPAQRLFDLVDYGNVGSIADDYTPPPEARRWWVPDPGTGPSIASWRVLGGPGLLAGGVSGEVRGPLFRFSKTGAAKLLWEVAP